MKIPDWLIRLGIVLAAIILPYFVGYFTAPERIFSEGKSVFIFWLVGLLIILIPVGAVCLIYIVIAFVIKGKLP